VEGSDDLYESHRQVMKPGNQLYLPGLDREWEEVDTMLLHACFRLLERYMAEEAALNDWGSSAAQQQVYLELQDLLAWWQERKQHQAPDDAQIAEDTQQLIRLVQLRTELWS